MPITWLSPPLGSLIEPDEEAGSARVSFTNDVISADVVLRCAWDQRYGVIDNMLSKPVRWPYLTNYRLYAVSGSVTSPQDAQALKDDPAGHGLKYPTALIAVHFETLNGGDVGNPGGGIGNAIYYETIEPNGEFLKLDHRHFTWSDGSKVSAEEAGGRLLIGLDYVVRWSRLVSIPEAAVTAVDHVNSDVVTSPSLGVAFGAESLLFNAPRISRSVSSVSVNNLYDMECRWSFRDHTWNKFWRQKTQSFDEMYYDFDPEPYKNFPTAPMAGMLP